MRSALTHLLAALLGGLVVYGLGAVEPTEPRRRESPRALVSPPAASGDADRRDGRDDGASPVPSAAVDSAAEPRVVALQQRLGEVEAELALVRVQLDGAKADPGSLTKYVNLTRDELLEMARNCDVRTDVPGPFSDEEAAEVGLNARERQLYGEALAEHGKARAATMRALYEEHTGAPAEGLSVQQLHDTLQALEIADRSAVTRDLAEERAGLRQRPPEADMSVVERYRRLRLEEGEDFEREVAARLGPARAHELRAAGDGWPGGRISYSGCPAK